jgi:hypothetical protein
VTIRRVPVDEMSPGWRQAVEDARRVAGDARFMEVVHNAPQIRDFYYKTFYREVFFRGTVPIRVKELGRMRLAQLHGCIH